MALADRLKARCRLLAAAAARRAWLWLVRPAAGLGAELLGLVRLRRVYLWVFWFGVDQARSVRYPQKWRLFGITLFVGLFGKGKTLSMIERGWRVRQKMGDGVRIVANFPCEFADEPFRGWQQIVDARLSDKSTLFLFDEIGNSFDQSMWKDFDKDLLPALTQSRKWGPGVAIYATAQRAAMVEVTWRRLAGFIVECAGWPDSRWIHQKAFAGEEEYNGGVPRYSPMSDRDLRKVDWTYSFIATDQLRTMYDTFYVARRLQRHGEASLPGWDSAQLQHKEEQNNLLLLEELRTRQGGGAPVPGAPARRRA